MINKPFEYFAPKSIGEAASLLHRYGSTAKLIAGGQSLVPLMNLGLAAPRRLIDLTPIKRAQLSYIRMSKKALSIGSMTTHHEVGNSALVKNYSPALHEAASTIADVQVRNRGTIGGSVCHADPAGDYMAPLLAVGAEFRVVNSKRARMISSEKFFVDIFETSLKRDELLTEIHVPKLPASVGSAYVKHKFVEGGFAIVGAAAVVSTDRRRTCDRVRVVLSGVSSTPIIVDAIEKELRGKWVDERFIDDAGSLAFEAVKEPLSDLHAPANYRREMASVFTKRALRSAIARSRRERA